MSLPEARALQAADLDRAKDALKAANACGGEVYRIVRVELDVEPPLSMIVDVKASALEGPRLPAPPEHGLSPADVYVPPELRGAFPEARPVVGGVAVYTSAEHERGLDKRETRLSDVTEAIGDHLFPENPCDLDHCLFCGASLPEAYARQRCGS